MVWDALEADSPCRTKVTVIAAAGSAVATNTTAASSAANRTFSDRRCDPETIGSQ